MAIRLTRKLALRIDGIDISAVRVGDVIELPEPHARMLLAEGWAELVFDRKLPTVQPEANEDFAVA